MENHALKCIVLARNRQAILNVFKILFQSYYNYPIIMHICKNNSFGHVQAKFHLKMHSHST